MQSPIKIVTRGPFLESPEKFSGTVKPFLDHPYLKTEKCIRSKRLV